MQGVVRDEGTRIPFTYEQGAVSDKYRTTVDGENFEGKAVFANASSGSGVAIANGQVVPVVTSTTTGNLVATLFGDRGSTMRCSMNYADSSGFTTMGGVGVCQHSDGRIIDVMW